MPSHPTWTIRPIRQSDRAQWQILWDGYNAFYGRVGATALPTEITHTLWTRFFDKDEPVYAIVAEENHRLIGFAHYLFHRSTTLIQSTCYLQDLYTEVDVRRRGVGRALIEGVRERAKAAGSPRLYWQTHESNSVAMRLYDSVAEKTGFVIYRIVIP
jgi:GNAT superfamily N-acetyltransferase